MVEIPKSPTPLLPSQQITPEARAARLALIEEAQSEAEPDHAHARPNLTAAADDVFRRAAAEQAVKAATALQAMVAARSQAQHDLDNADGNLGYAFEQVTQSFSEQPAFQTMPSRRKKSPVCQPSTPSQPAAFTQERFESPAPAIAPAIIPGGRLVLPAAALPSAMLSSQEAAPCPAAQALGPWYIVYHGRDGHQGFFDRFNGVDDELSVKGLTQFYEHRLYKKFDSFQKAWMFWTEVKDSGILGLLRDPPTKGEIFIVTKGALPGVYANRMSLLIEGLAWRGGEVMSGIGKKARFEDVFKQWDAQNLTECLPRDGPLREFRTAGDTRDAGKEVGGDTCTEIDPV
ncbi:hypothetical protein C8J55DRAFT_567854 [Lentinula edodes]|uniref:Uncharacterized protein n=1 Tax=Lentinula lateritia TaxID=40482 RepID=A0A9W8ZNG7_9AGAR|nr:hypothetical protein C8J55DRAFT_567854 [Lentinula edodes]